MYDFLIHNQQFVVLFIVLIIWLGLFFVIFQLNKKLNQIEKTIKSKFISSNNKENT